ncbi:DNA-binding protein HU [Rhizobium grahamii CCGE 502]|uniref:DNA-binding protein HU n=1 Tax=Rhizobium grahamii CCGE 502 TaxID=990285 RepID=S3IJ02_9HYPH|nr:DNA-binding protein HU [Rhizobium grahamii CCGE 502]
MTASFRPLPGVNFGTLRAGISTSAPVDGLRPFVAARWETVKLPKPARRTSPLPFSSAWTTSKTASTAEAASVFESPAFSATADTSSFLFMFPPLSNGSKRLKSIS